MEFGKDYLMQEWLESLKGGKTPKTVVMRQRLTVPSKGPKSGGSLTEGQGKEGAGVKVVRTRYADPASKSFSPYRTKDERLRRN